jgi:diguanylate cyclase (GGDEF)-like protein
MVLLLIFALRFTNPFFPIKSNIKAFLLIIPFITLILCLLKHGIFIAHFEILRFYPFKELSIIKGIWFYISAVYGYICLALAAAMFYQHYRLSSVIYKWQSLLFITGICALFILDLLGIISDYEGFGIIGILILCWIMYYTYLHFRASDLAFVAASEVFEMISSIVLVVELNGKILYINSKAREAFSLICKSCEGMQFDDLLQTWLQERSGVMTEEKGVSLIVIDDDGRKWFDILKSPVTDRSGKHIGDFYELRDVTIQHDLIEQLYKLVNYDQLTGILNRRYFETRLAELDEEKYLPLCILSADLNNLKTVNDTFGHAYGDRMLIVSAEHLKESAPDQSDVCRIGGDEFAVIIPNCTKQCVESYITKVRESNEGYHENPFGNIDLSIGYSIRDNMGVSLTESLKQADMAMYTDKAQKKYEERSKARTYHG